jgi:hypothetical protein
MLDFFSLSICHIRDLEVSSRGREVKLCKVSDGTRVVGKCLKNFLIPCFGSSCVWELRNISQIVRKKYTTFRTERIVTLRSVNNISRRATISQLILCQSWYIKANYFSPFYDLPFYYDVAWCVQHCKVCIKSDNLLHSCVNVVRHMHFLLKVFL